MREIPLTQGKVALVDDDCFDWLNQWAWQFDKQGGYALRKYRKVVKKERIIETCISMHRQIMAFPDLKVDHINRNRLDNRRANLREVSDWVNALNQSMRSTNKTGFRGVCWTKYNSYEAYIHVRGKKHWLGYFKDIKAAALARDRAASFHFGSEAILNFPENT
jgi:hypothetical protein